MRRLKALLCHPIIAGFLVFALVLGGGAAGLNYVASYLDAETAARERASVQYALSNRAAIMTSAALKTSAEKDMLASLARKDFSQIHNLLGKPLGTQFGFEFVYVTDATGQLIYSSEYGHSGAKNYFPALTSALAKLARDVDPGSPGLAVTGPSQTAMMVMYVFRQTDPSLQMSQPLRIYVGDILDPELLHLISGAAEADSLRVVHEEPEDPSVLRVANLTDEKPLWVTWEGREPGRDLQARLLALIAGVAILLALVFFVLMLRFRHLARALVEKEAQAREIAQSDRLTNLANREHFLTQLEMALGPPASPCKMALFFIDLDAFKDINDTSGHTVGDEVLREIGRRLSACVGHEGRAARFGGDEFVLFVSFDDIEDLHRLAEDIFAAAARPIHVEDEELYVSVSIGVAHAPRDGRTAGELLRRADIALYRAKAEGRDTCRMFEPVFEAEQQERRRVERELLVALEKNQLFLLYQPQVDVETERVAGFEALVRWNHPTRGQIRPDEFIPVAERAGLIHLVDAYVLRTACREAHALPGVVISVNMSPLDLRHPRIVENIRKTLQETGFDPARLELELTESAMLDTNPDILRVLASIRALGVSFAFDDFGTGHASLVHVRRFPVNKIKIDKSFIFNLGLQREAGSIVEYVVRLGRSLGITLTAEGVETREQLRFLRAFGAHQAQGYLFAPPLSLEEAIALLNAQNDGTSTPNWPTAPSLAAAAPGTTDARTSLDMAKRET